MHWLQRIFPLRLWPFIIFVFILAAVLLGGDYYRGLLKRRGLARVATTVRRAIADKTRVPELKMERSTLEFQLDGLPRKFPILTNAALARDWSSSASLARLDQDVDEAWNSYWKQVSPLVLEVNHRLEFFVALQTAYDLDVGQIIRDWTITNKPAVLLNLQANKFASLFTNPVCLDDRKEFEAAAAKITGESFSRPFFRRYSRK